MNSNTSATATAVNPELTPLEKEQARLYIQQARDGAIGATRGLSEAQWSFKPAPDRWSIAEILEHVVFVQERVLGPIWEQLAAAPPAPGGYDREQVDSIAMHRFPTRLTRFPAPEFALPNGRWTHSEALERLAANSAGLIERLESWPDLRAHALEAAPLKAVSQGKYQWMDGYQWLVTAAAHTERHTKQMLEVKASPDFLVN
jgi:hypothetical protein